MQRSDVLSFGLVAGFLLGTPALAQGDQSQIDRGKYLVTVGDCAACHTAPGGKYLAGNYALNMPFGVIMTPNLTPDKETGLGDYSYNDFEQAFRNGYSKHVGYLYPAFPFGWFTKVTDDDTKAIWAYLQSVPAVNEKRKDNQIPFPFSVREALVTWRTVFFTNERFKPDPSASAEVNRGGYLVESLGHCAMCHNENKLVGNSSFAGRFGGGVIDGWYAPNITPNDHQGIGAWTDDQVVTYLKTGTAPGDRPGVAAGPMRQTIEESLSKLPEADLRAMVLYLRTVPAKQTYKPKDLAAFDTADAPGASTYLTYCSSCHQPDGKGIPGAVPGLAGNTSVQSEGPETVLRVIYGGLAAQSGYAPMLAIGQQMTDVEVKNVTDYVRNSWGNKAPVVTGDKASEARAATKTMLAGTAPCGVIAQDKLKAAFQQVGIQDSLKGLKMQDFVPTLARLVPQIKAVPTGASDDDIVNGLTDAFCAVGRDDPQYGSPGWPTVIGSFANVAYSQVRNPEKQAIAVPGATVPPKRN
ncbi:c-type cytochrome [Methylobacterium sp. NEAU 140]|uniref:c-type cytochrome n=1 Tax=Methylobacterium sp. NEAU 140 TaxID=3064945 RepID=UPI00273315E8|nr:c-type cytochrome [Methylobacterium sp. NEAU 140]MDP4025409.1 c-type cytochrome [Methylobacterium sp. NEAU 140]